jgi:hypothetical protein
MARRFRRAQRLRCSLKSLLAIRNWNWIEAARRKWMTAQQSAQRENASAPPAMKMKSKMRVFRAGRLKAACARMSDERALCRLQNGRQGIPVNGQSTLQKPTPNALIPLSGHDG